MKDFSEYSVILWDFDGVILNSMPIRDKGFQEVLVDYPENEVKALLEYHNQNGGLSRYHKFRYFYEEIRGEKVTEDTISELAERFSAIMLSHLVDESLLIKDSVSFIKERGMKYDMHIVSGSDEKELKTICEGLKLTEYFNSINGSPRYKKDIVAKLLEEFNYDKNNVALIGDSINDYEAAESNQISFFGYNNPKLKSNSVKYLDTLK